jgi:hypothetical protein
MYKLLNWSWKAIVNLIVSSIVVMFTGAVVAVLIKAFMFGFNLVWNFL